MLGTDMRSELFVALQFEVHLQFVNRFTVERPYRYKLPRAFGASPALKILSFDPFHPASLRLHGTPRVLVGLCILNRGEAQLLDGTAAAKNLRLIALREVLPKSCLSETRQN
jgi:hypothetical protein